MEQGSVIGKGTVYVTFALLIFIVLLASSCTPPGSEISGETPGKVNFITVNGVDCVVWTGYEAGSISCDWGDF